MITNITTQSFSDFAKTVEKKAVVPPQRQRLDLLASYYTDRVSANEIQLITKYATSLVSGGQPHTPDPRLYMRRDLLGLVQDSYALGIADALQDLEDVQFSDKKTDADFALSADDKLQRDIQKLQRDIQASQQIIRQTKTLNQYTNTLQSLQQQAQALNNTRATQTLSQLSQQLDAIKTGNIVRGATKLINQQIQKGQAQATTAQQIVATDSPNTQDYLVKRAIEEKLKYLENRRDSLAATPPVLLDEDTDFFRWYADKRLVPIANRYQQGIVDKNNDAKDIATKYTEEINKGTTTQAAKGTATDKIVRKLLSIENNSTPSPKDKKPPIKRVQRVVATELAIAYNIGRLKAYLKAGVQYVTISTSMYSPDVCKYCAETTVKTEEEPIKISSLLKNAYRNQGFNKDTQPKVSDLRYLPNHPYCYCYYKPHPRRDDEDTDNSQGIYSDPNSWRFILGAGLGVSLAFLAFALTTGRKISIPETIPALVPRINLPVPTRQRMPDTIPVDAKPLQLPQGVPAIRPDLRSPLTLRYIFDDVMDFLVESDLSEEQQALVITRMFERSRNNTDTFDNLLETQLELGNITTPEYAKRIIDAVAKKRGLTKELYFRRFDKVADNFNKTVSPQSNIDRLANKVDRYVDSVDGGNIIRAATNIEKIKIDKQLQPISLLRSDLVESLQRVSAKVNKKQADLTYINDLQARIADLNNFATILDEQKTQLQNIRGAVRIVNKNVVQQQIAVTQVVVERLATDSSVLQEALDKYQDLLEMLVVLPQKEASKYDAMRNDLNRRIKDAQGLKLKRFTGDLSQFKRYMPYFS